MIKSIILKDLGWTVIFVLILFLITSCNSNTSKGKKISSASLFSIIPGSESGITFKNPIEESPRLNGLMYEYMYNGGGVAIGDINNDGLPDVFLTGNQVPNQLYLNKGSLQFENISSSAGFQSNRWSTGAVFVDINQDGWLDLYVCNSGPDASDRKRVNQLYINNGLSSSIDIDKSSSSQLKNRVESVTFSEKASVYGIANGDGSTHATFFDYDKDGDLDLYVLNHSFYLNLLASVDLVQGIKHVFEESAQPDKLKQSSSAFYKNNGNGTFTDVTVEAGLARFGFGLGVVASDLNHDGWVDLYVANDFYIPDFYFLNQKTEPSKMLLKS